MHLEPAVCRRPPRPLRNALLTQWNNSNDLWPFSVEWRTRRVRGSRTLNAAIDRIFAPTRELGWREPAARGPAPAPTPPGPNEDAEEARAEAVTRPTFPTLGGTPRGLHGRSREWSRGKSIESTTSRITGLPAPCAAWPPLTPAISLFSFQRLPAIISSCTGQPACVRERPPRVPLPTYPLPRPRRGILPPWTRSKAGADSRDCSPDSRRGSA